MQDIRGVFVQDAGQLPRPPYLGPWPAKLHDYAKKVFSLFSSRFDQVAASILLYGRPLGA